jgi:hypothetical protein
MYFGLGIIFRIVLVLVIAFWHAKLTKKLAGHMLIAKFGKDQGWPVRTVYPTDQTDLACVIRVGLDLVVRDLL